MAIGRLQAALASATNEVTVAAANLNFDFTLIKCEAPKEYQALGNVLSTKRKENAEFGSSHVLARQLGALFDGVCPPTPALLEAYGNRASEIAKVAKESSKPFAETLFGDYTGIDGTSIWAAATSSKSALHIHLLACLLARVWSAPEAIAIWVELVSERKKEIARKVDQGEPVAFALAAAVGQDISRPQLAALDTSARAWLRTADDVFCRKQKQLDLILKNLELTMPGGPTVFPSVIQTWKIALETMNNLVSGIPQAIRDGAALLGLSAWHLYPNMSIYGSGFVEVKMEDPSISEGGMLSLGVSRRPDSSSLESGVRWSLSLSQLRHYGRPVRVTRGLEASARLTWPQFSLVLFAALLEGFEMKNNGQAFTQLLISLPRYLDSTAYSNEHLVRILKLLTDGASAYTNRMIGDQDMNHKLIQLGRRRSREFFKFKDSGFEDVGLPLFSIFHQVEFDSAFKDVDSAVSYFRHAAQRLRNESTPSDAYLIRHSIVSSVNRFTPKAVGYVVMTALAPTSQERMGTGSHHRWLPANFGDIPVPDSETSSLDVLVKFDCTNKSLWTVSENRTRIHLYRPIIGDCKATALFAQCPPDRSRVRKADITIEDFQWCLDHDLLHPEKLLQQLEKAFSSAENRMTMVIRALGAAALIYDDLPDATIDANILTRPLASTKWFRAFQFGHFDHEAVLSMIAYLETGIHDTDPKLLRDAIAVSYGDSLYVSSALIQDPYESLTKREFASFRRILGNIGKPGLTFLLPPQEPMMREIDTGSWRLDSYHHFDGTTSPSFQSTSMHLSFTDYHVPIFDGMRGSYDNQIFFLESVISIQDRGEWIADVNPLPLVLPDDDIYGNALIKVEMPDTTGLRGQSSCQHNINTYCKPDITAVDTWNELLDAPAGIFVVRTGDNWVPRLAATLVAYQRIMPRSPRNFIMICPPQVCWTCVTEEFAPQAFIF